jgi:nitrate reductase gamma subunit
MHCGLLRGSKTQGVGMWLRAVVIGRSETASDFHNSVQLSKRLLVIIGMILLFSVYKIVFLFGTA